MVKMPSIVGIFGDKGFYYIQRTDMQIMSVSLPERGLKIYVLSVQQMVTEKVFFGSKFTSKQWKRDVRNQVPNRMKDIFFSLHVKMRITAMKRYSTLPRVPELESHHKMRSRVTPWAPLFILVFPLCREYSQCFVSSTDRTKIFWLQM